MFCYSKLLCNLLADFEINPPFIGLLFSLDTEVMN